MSGNVYLHIIIIFIAGVCVKAAEMCLQECVEENIPPVHTERGECPAVLRKLCAADRKASG